MTIASVGSQVFSDTSGSNASTLASTAFSLPAGHLVTVAVKWETAAAVTSVTDTAGNTYTAGTPADDTTRGQHAQVFYCLSSTANAANVVSVNWGSGNAQFLTATVRWSSYAGSVSLTAQNAAIGGSTTTATTSAISAGGFAVAAISDFGGDTTTPGSGWTEDSDVSAVGGHTLSRYDTPGGSYSASATFTAAQFWAIAAASFSEAGGGPTITVQPQGQSAAVGGTATFSITATGTAPTYQWQLSTDLGQTFSNIAGATSTTYTTPAAVAADNGKKFRCVVTEGSAVTSLDAWFFVAGLSITGDGRRAPGSAWLKRQTQRGGARSGRGPSALRNLHAQPNEANQDIAAAWAAWFFQPIPTPPPPVIAYREPGSARNRPGRGPFSRGKFYVGKLWDFVPPAAATGGTITGAGNIASAEAFGAPSLAAVVSPASVASAEAIGAPIVVASVVPAGVPTAEAFGAPAIAAQIAPAGLSSAEAIGSAQLAAVVSTAGVATAEAFGAPVIGASIVAAGIASAEAIGQPALAANVQTSGISSAEAFGQPTVGGAAAADIFGASIASAEAFGSPALAAVVQPAGVATAEAIGQPTVGSAAALVDVAGIPSAEAFGTPALAVVVAPAGVASGEVGPGPVLAVNIGATGIATAEAFGQPTITLNAAITAAGIASAEVFGAPAVAATVTGGFVDTAEAFGLPTVQLVGPVQIVCTGIASEEAFGSPRIGNLADDQAVGAGRRRMFDARRPVRLALRGIPSEEAFGAPILLPPLEPLGIASVSAVGAPSIGVSLAPRSVDSGPAAFGDVRISYRPTPEQLIDEMWLLAGR